MSLRPKPGRSFSFTIIELLTAIAVFSIILVIVVSITGQASNLWRNSTNKIEAFQSARTGFDLITRNLSQATLNTYLNYDNSTNPQYYLRVSELAYVNGPAGVGNMPGTAGCGEAVFFQAPLGYATNTAFDGELDSLMNTCGYFVSFNTNNTIPAHVSATQNHYRYRLMQLLVPSENNTIYVSSGNIGWFTNFISQAQPVADNVITLLVRPQDPAIIPSDITTNYVYDSTTNATTTPQPSTANQLPPFLQVTMVAIDEASAARLDNGSTSPAVINSALTTGGRFTNTGNYNRDMSGLEADLNQAHIRYTVFSSAVPIRESKWTK
jgi:uncharacterized protein (TIGR02599 family)